MRQFRAPWSPKARLNVLQLEDRAVPANFAVMNTLDAGAGSLRQAIADANANAGADTITFDAGVTGSIGLTTGELLITDSLTITGPGATLLEVNGNNASRVLRASGPGTLVVNISGLTITGGNSTQGGGIFNDDEILTLDGLRIVGNNASNDGGGVWADGFNMGLTIRNCVISGNTAGNDGGGIYIEDVGGSVLIEDTEISGNNAVDDGGGVYLYDPDSDVTFDRCIISGNTTGDRGGGIYLYNMDSGAFTIRNSTFSGNSAASGGGVFLYSPNNGGTIENSTFFGNVATSGSGGAIYLYEASTFSLRNVTIVGNTAASRGGGVYVENSNLPVINSIIANNVGIDNPDIAESDGSFELSFSLVETVGTTTITDNGGNIFGQDPLLGPLANHGGPTQTLLPANNSPAVNAGDPNFAPPPTTDQRGLPRVAGGRLDMGAVERQPPTISSGSTSSFNVGQPGSFTFTTSGGDQAISLTLVGTLPPGLTFVDNGDGTATLSGTPAVGSEGTFPLTITAANGILPDAVQSFTLSVVAAPTPPSPPAPVNQNAWPLYSTSGNTGGVSVRNPQGDPTATAPGVGSGGTRAAIADVNGDGVPDTIATNGPGGTTVVEVFDGVSGATLSTFSPFESTFTGGAFVAAGDVDGDGFADVAVSADTTGGPRVVLYSGRDGSVLADFLGIDDPGFRGGARVALGDVNGDGFADLVVAAGAGGGPRIAVFDGTSLRPSQIPIRLLPDFFAFEPSLRDGAYVTVGDVNGDTFADLTFGGGPTGGPRVLIWDAASLLSSGPAGVGVISDFFADDPGLRLGGVRVTAKDLDGDAFSDLVVGVSTSATTSVVKTYLGTELNSQSDPTASTVIDPGTAGVFVG